MVKAIKKKHRRLKKRIRKTLGTLFLVSALVVSAIPADSLQAADDTDLDAGVKVDQNKCGIPIVNEGETVYTTGDGRYQFAYVPPNQSETNKVAVILGYNGGFLADDGALEIPNTVDAYSKYSDNMGTQNGYVAVGKTGNYLFYKVMETVLDENGQPIMDPDKNKPILDENNKPVTDENGDPVYEMVERKQAAFYPCYYEDYAAWKDIALDQYYYTVSNTVTGNDASQFLLTNTADKQRIQGAEVRYIGNQYLEPGEKTGTWKVGKLITLPEQGIFAGQKGGNITSLTVGDSLSGIGDYAFYDCAMLSSIKLGNGLDTIGNYAFANCANMTSADFPVNARIKIIGENAFFNCRGLTSFSIPVAVTQIGNSAFDNCTNLQEIDLRGGGRNVLLEKIGHYAFRNCSSLKYLALPDNYKQEMDISMLQGCNSLQYISAPNAQMNFVQTRKTNSKSDFGFEEFAKQVPAEFYFEGIGEQKLHKTATDNSFAFHYWNQDSFEITIINEDGYKAVYRVNSNDELIWCEIAPEMSTVEIPPTVGPHKITRLNASSFMGNCYLKKVTIPSSITSIEANTFKGCHNLKSVMFTSPVNLTEIGVDAFQTQEVTTHKSGCKNKNFETDLNPTLNFIGPIDNNCKPFSYAMDPNSNINVGNQVKTYIKYFSGWPENLVVQYNWETDKNELIEYPTFSGLSKYKADQGDGTGDYPYMTDDYVKAAKEAATNFVEGNSMTEYQTQIVNSALNIVLPEGIEAIKQGVFTEGEKEDAIYNAESDPKYEKIVKSITSYGLKDIAANSFEDCVKLQSVYLYGNVESIGDYAFKNCKLLENAVVASTVSSLGLSPFIGCNKLKNVDFQNSSYFTCDNSIIFGLENGVKKKVIEYLNGRETGVVEPAELEGITEIAPEAFRNTNVSSVDFRKSGITDLPEFSFADTKSLFSVYLPYGCLSISDDTFTDSSLKYLEVPSTVSYIGPYAFRNITPSTLTFYCEDGTNAKIYADKNGFKTSQKPVEQWFTVRFWDDEANLLDEYTQQVEAGKDAVPPELTKEGYTFDKWVPDYHSITRDTDCTAQFKPIDPDSLKHTVKFYDFNNNEIDSQLVPDGEDADPPTAPEVEGYTFKGWKPEVTNITKDTDIYAWYEPKNADEYTVNFYDDNQTLLYTQTVTSGKTVIMPKDPVKTGYTFQGWLPSIDGVPVTADINVYARYDKTGGDGGGDGGSTTPTSSTGSSGTSGSSSSGGGNNGTNAKYYTLTVKNGSGSGSYVAGTQPIVIANDSAEGMEFDNWTVDPGNVTIASKTLSATVVTMPEANVTLTANYKTKGSAGSSTGSGNSSTNTSGNKNNGSGSGGTVTKPGGNGSGGTTVVIDKNGLSNTGVVSAVVNGSSDDFTIKITESTEASEAVVKALMDKYGDLTDIKYFPMDISLYDSTGSKKITDTTGLSIKITLPLPDSLKEYAGNNKTAAVSNNKLEDLTEKFTTISGVPCVTFTAEHFSPYAIYVDTANLTAGTNSDMTPKTGDGIHPKWFLAIGLACISLVLFMKQDKKPPVKRTAVVRAK